MISWNTLPFSHHHPSSLKVPPLPSYISSPSLFPDEAIDFTDLPPLSGEGTESGVSDSAPSHCVDICGVGSNEWVGEGKAGDFQ